MKRSVSLSFLPTSSPDGGESNTPGGDGNTSRIRRRLPDTGQGRLIQQVPQHQSVPMLLSPLQWARNGRKALIESNIP